MIEFSQTISTVIMGIVEGVTEFLPVSSTGHLIIAANFIKFQADEGHFFEVFIQLGAILAVVCLYWKRFVGFLHLNNKDKHSFQGLNGIIKIVIACIPACLFGLFFGSAIKENLFVPKTVAIALIAGAVMMLIAEWFVRHKMKRSNKGPDKSLNITTTLDDLTNKQAFAVGLFQCLSLWPGMSRSASTICGAMFFGVSRVVAAEFSFLVAVPIMCAATLYDGYKSWASIDVSLLPTFILGFIVSFIFAVIAIKFMIAILNKWSLTPFAYYRIILGVGLLLFL